MSGINFKEIFGKVIDTTLGVLGDAAAGALRKTPLVQAAVKAEVARSGGSSLWSALPVVVAGGMLFMIFKWK